MMTNVPGLASSCVLQEHEKELLKKHFKQDNARIVKDYIGCKLNVSRDGRILKMTQIVLVEI